MGRRGIKVRLSLSGLGRTFGGLGTLLMVIDFALENQYAKTRPRVSEAQSGRIYPLNVSRDRLCDK
jgi:hypothetical protein